MGRHRFLTAGALLMAIGIAGSLFFHLGLEVADKLASVISMFLALAGLGMSAAALRRPASGRPADVPPEVGMPDNTASGPNSPTSADNGSLVAPPPGDGDTDTYRVTNFGARIVTVGRNQVHYHLSRAGRSRWWRRG